MALPSTRAIANSAQVLDLIPIVNSITSLLQTLNPRNPIPINLTSSPLSRFSPFLDPNLVTLVIHKQTNPYHALFFFNCASNPNPNPNNYSHNHTCYEAITDLLLRHSLFHPTVKLLEKSQKLSDFFVGKIIKAYGDRVKANLIDLVETLFDNVVKEGVVQPDVSSYTILMRVLCKKGMVESARKVLDEMPCEPNLIAYNTLINGYCKKGDLESANLVFDKILTEVDFLPDVVTYTTLIDGYCRKGEFVEAKRCLNMMMKAGCSPNVVTYNAIIYALCLKGEVDEAKKMITEMTLNGVKDNTATHLNILKGLAVAGRSLEALEYFKWMAGCNMNLDAKAYIVVVKEYCKLRKIDEAIFLLKGMCERGFSHNMPQMGCMPNSVSYRTVICSLCGTEGRMREVGYLVDDMLRYGIPVDATMYGCMLEGYSKTGNEDVAMQQRATYLERQMENQSALSAIR
uniref:Uncharacterized protein n=1 Tax=Gossypium hirsutum TaxID=3635 RepID=A0A346KJY5_GOSHI|nr:hypothetical protein Gohir.A07G020700 [Gossypium hirsutum]